VASGQKIGENTTFSIGYHLAIEYCYCDETWSVLKPQLFEGVLYERGASAQFYNDRGARNWDRIRIEWNGWF
jgi:hypothetical protein